MFSPLFGPGKIVAQQFSWKFHFMSDVYKEKIGVTKKHVKVGLQGPTKKLYQQD